MKRRNILKGSLATGGLSVAAGVGLLPSTAALADYPTAAFDAKDVTSTLEAIGGLDGASDSADIQLKAPVQAENGAVVPIKVTTNTAVESIHLVVEENPRPLVMSANFSEGANGFLSGRIKMGKTSNVVAYAKTAGGAVIKAAQEVKVTVGGCGG